MNSLQLYAATGHDPFENLATEEHLLRTDGDAVFLWVNDPCVIIGRNQNPLKEADLGYIAENNVALARRLSGGGAVYQDRGNLNFSLISGAPIADLAIDLALSVLRSVGIEAEKAGRNDILVSGAKVGGMAECFDCRYLCHGTMMAAVDLESMARALSPSPLKLSKNGVESVRSRVSNLSAFDPGITVEKLIGAFEDCIGIACAPIKPDAEIEAKAARLRSHDWLFGATPPFDVAIERLIRNNVYALELSVEGGFVTAARIYTDSLELYDFESVSRRIEGIPYPSDSFEAALQRLLP